MRKLYPIQRLSQLFGQSGTFMSWLWTAKTFVSTSQTTHLKNNKKTSYADIDVEIRTLIVKSCMYDVKPLQNWKCMHFVHITRCAIVLVRVINIHLLDKSLDKT
jgi:hypothetical protein